MATGDKVYIADKETLDNVNSNVGATSDAAGTATTGTVMGKLNKLIEKADTGEQFYILGTAYSENLDYYNAQMGKITSSYVNRYYKMSNYWMAKKDGLITINLSVTYTVVGGTTEDAILTRTGASVSGQANIDSCLFSTNGTSLSTSSFISTITSARTLDVPAAETTIYNETFSMKTPVSKGSLVYAFIEPIVSSNKYFKTLVVQMTGASISYDLES